MHLICTVSIETQYHLAVMISTTSADELPLLAALEGAGLRQTAPRRALAALISRQTGHFTAADLLADVRSACLSVGRATVFRTLELYAELNALERIDLPTGEHAYVACEPAHHHHVVCHRCARVTDVDDAGMAAVATEMERRTGYVIDTHRLELFGLCPRCQLETSA
jgi:Fur family transcriptional regulator, ferric uptake regulator